MTPIPVRILIYLVVVQSLQSLLELINQIHLVSRQDQTLEVAGVLLLTRLQEQMGRLLEL